MVEEELLTRLDETDEVRDREIDAQYERAYAGGPDPLGRDFTGWEEEGVWPLE